MLIADLVYGDDPDMQLQETLLGKLPKYLKSLVDVSTVSLLRAQGVKLDTIFESEGKLHNGRRIARTVTFGDKVVHILEK